MPDSIITPNKLTFHVFRDERFIDLNLYQFGWERTEPLHFYGPHTRNHYLFHYVISGKGRLYANETEYPIHPGQGCPRCFPTGVPANAFFCSYTRE